MFDFDWNLVVVIGIAVFTVSLLTKVIGFPDQLMRNFRRKSTEGVSFSFAILSFISYILWGIYGLLQQDWVVLWAQGILGSAITGAILYQFFLYRNK